MGKAGLVAVKEENLEGPVLKVHLTCDWSLGCHLLTSFYSGNLLYRIVALGPFSVSEVSAPLKLRSYGTMQICLLLLLFWLQNNIALSCFL